MEGCGKGSFMHIYLGQVVVPLWTRFSFGPFEELLLIYYNYGFFLCGSSCSSRVERNGVSRTVRLSPKAAKGAPGAPPPRAPGSSSTGLLHGPPPRARCWMPLYNKCLKDHTQGRSDKQTQRATLERPAHRVCRDGSGLRVCTTFAED